MTTLIQSVLDKNRLAKFEELKAATGLTTAALMRRMVDAAEVEPMRVKVNLSTNANDDVKIRQDSHAVAA